MRRGAPGKTHTFGTHLGSDSLNDDVFLTCRTPVASSSNLNNGPFVGASSLSVSQPALPHPRLLESPQIDHPHLSTCPSLCIGGPQLRCQDCLKPSSWGLCLLLTKEESGPRIDQKQICHLMRTLIKQGLSCLPYLSLLPSVPTLKGQNPGLAS